MLYAGFFEGITPRFTQDRCSRCGDGLVRQERVRPVFIAGVVSPSPAGAGRVLVLASDRANNIYNELVHVDCVDRKIDKLSLIEPPPRKYGPLMNPAQLQEINPRGEPYKCVRCKKDFEREDRVFSMHIVLGTGFNAEAHGNVTACSSNYEMTHVDCRDPKLSGSGAIVVTGG